MPQSDNPTLGAAFEQAAKDIHSLEARPDNATLLHLYGLYKQGAEGDAGNEKPGFFDFVGTAKYEAWVALRGLDRQAAMQQYIDLVGKLRGTDTLPGSKLED